MSCLCRTSPACVLHPLAPPPPPPPLQFYIGEGNSVSGGGMSGVSDVYSATLWSADVMLNMASVGVARWNWHGEPAGWYSIVWYPESVRQCVCV